MSDWSAIYCVGVWWVGWRLEREEPDGLSGGRRAPVEATRLVVGEADSQRE